MAKDVKRTPDQDQQYQCIDRQIGKQMDRWIGKHTDRLEYEYIDKQIDSFQIDKYR